MTLFGDVELDLTDRILRAYEHKAPWVNRIILGDSLVVMNSLFEYEGMGGKVQMIYMDPPYASCSYNSPIIGTFNYIIDFMQV
jgi:adenine-specific DNA-methyltransferase